MNRYRGGLSSLIQASPDRPSMPPDAPHPFSTDHLQPDLKGRSVRGGAITLIAQALKFIIGLGGTAFLARLLSPEDFGLIAMVVVLIGFATLFNDLGLALSTVQRQEVTHEQISTLFWINVALGGLIALLVCALSPAVAWFYDDPRLVNITLILALSFLFGGLTTQHQALLMRRMRFSALAAIQVSALLLGTIVAIYTAQWYFENRKYWALVVMQLTTGFITMLGVWIICRWRPGAPQRDSGVRPMLAFGGNLTGANLLTYLIRNLDNVLIGWKLGDRQLGLYAKAYQLLLLPLQQINYPLTNVAIPTLSRLQNDPDRYRLFYLKGIQLLVMVGMPAVVFLFVASEKVILLVLGEQWTDAVPIFKALAPAAFVGTFNVAMGWVYLSRGESNRLFRWAIFASLITALAFVIGLQWGVLGVAIGFSIAMCSLQLPGILYCYRGTPLTLAHLGSVLWRPALTAIMAGFTLDLAHRYLPSPHWLPLSFLQDAVVYTLALLAFWLVIPQGKTILREVIALTKDLRTP